MSENEDTAVETTDESKFFTYDGPNPKLSYPLKIIYCDGKYDILYLVLSFGFIIELPSLPEGSARAQELFPDHCEIGSNITSNYAVI